MPDKKIIQSMILPSNPANALRRIVQAKLKRSRRKKLPRAPRILFPDPAKRAYTKALVDMAKELKRLTKARIIPRLAYLSNEAQVGKPVRRDSWHEDTETLINDTRLEFARKYTDEEIRRLAEITGKSINYWNKRELSKVASRVLDINILTDEPWLKPHLDGFVKVNVGLIRSIPKKHFDDVEQTVMRGFLAGTPWESIASDLETKFKATENRAKLIARDQVGKLAGQLTKTRQQDLGIEKYTWRTSMDERVVGNPDGRYPDADPDDDMHGDHWEREGQVFSWNEPPPDGNPGEPIQCRCYAEPVFPGEDDGDE